MQQGATAGFPKKRIRVTISGGRVVLTQCVQMSVAFQPRAGYVFLEPSSMVFYFTEEEYSRVIATLKNNKAAGRDDVLVEQLKNSRPKAHKLMLTNVS